MLVFATVAALVLSQEWNMGYGELIPYATPGFIAFAIFALPSGWLADRWSRQGMMAIFFIGIGLASSATALAQTPLQIGIGLFAIGVFAAIYHPVGIALVVEGRTQVGIPLAINGIFGNLGVACAALITGFLIDNTGWRSAFVWPGILSVAIGLAYLQLVILKNDRRTPATTDLEHVRTPPELVLNRHMLVRIFIIVFFSTAIGGLIFQSTTFSLPKVFDERLSDLAGSATMIGWFAFIVLAIAAMGQLIVGYLIDRHPIRYIFMGVALIQAALFAIMPGLTDWEALAVSMIFMLAVFGQIPINDTLVSRITKSEWRSRVFALRYIVTFSATASSVPFIAWVYERWGFDTLFIVLAFAAALIFSAVALLPALSASAVPAE